ncbi:MAG TPA: hypothetical protein VGB74_03835 [Actinoplanes sp.]
MSLGKALLAGSLALSLVASGPVVRRPAAVPVAAPAAAQASSSDSVAKKSTIKCPASSARRDNDSVGLRVTDPAVGPDELPVDHHGKITVRGLVHDKARVVDATVDKTKVSHIS